MRKRMILFIATCMQRSRPCHCNIRHLQFTGIDFASTSSTSRQRSLEGYCLKSINRMVIYRMNGMLETKSAAHSLFIRFGGMKGLLSTRLLGKLRLKNPIDEFPKNFVTNADWMDMN
jgi:hypothetical protein